MKNKIGWIKWVMMSLALTLYGCTGAAATGGAGSASQESAQPQKSKSMTPKASPTDAPLPTSTATPTLTPEPSPTPGPESMNITLEDLPPGYEELNPGDLGLIVGEELLPGKVIQSSYGFVRSGPKAEYVVGAFAKQDPEGPGFISLPGELAQLEMSLVANSWGLEMTSPPTQLSGFEDMEYGTIGGTAYVTTPDGLELKLQLAVIDSVNTTVMVYIIFPRSTSPDPSLIELVNLLRARHVDLETPSLD